MSVVWALIPVFLAAVLIGFLMIFLTREKRMKRQGKMSPFRNPPRKTVAPVAKMEQVIRNDGPLLQPHKPAHRVGRIEVPKFASASAASGDTIILGASTGNKVCPYCSSSIEPRDIFACPACKTAHHRACWDTYEGCSVLGCKQAPTKR